MAIATTPLPVLAARPAVNPRRRNPACARVGEGVGSTFRIRDVRFFFLTASAQERRLLSVQPVSASLGMGSTALLTDTWGVFAVLSAGAVLGKWSETKAWGKALSGPLVATLVGLLCSNLGLIPTDSSVYPFINKYLLPMAVPMLLMSADLRKVMRDTGRLLAVFCIGAVGTLVGTALSFKLIPLTSLGPDSWKVASALCARHIGGAINYVAVAEALDVTPSVLTAGLAADNLICALYFTLVFMLASGIPEEVPGAAGGDIVVVDESEFGGQAAVTVWEAGCLVAMSSALCAAGSGLAAAMGSPGLTIPIVSTLAVMGASAFPAFFGPFAPAGESIASVILPLFFAAVGANGDVRAVVTTAPSLFVYSFLQIAGHLAWILSLGRLLGFSRKDVLVASNANVGGPQTAAGMASAKGWRRTVVPAILIGTFGYATATVLACALGVGVLKGWAAAAAAASLPT